MNCCSHCQDAGYFFNKKTAKRELKKYNRNGPNKSTRLLLDEIREQNLNGKSILDIGGGIGAISFELLEAGVSTSVHVDASTSYLDLTKKEAVKRGLGDRITHLFGDFTEISHLIDLADIVTLDRVICCYPDMEKLVDRSVEKSKLFYGVVYPRELWPTRWVMLLGNFWFKLRGNDFRTYLHPPADIDARIKNSGFKRIDLRRTIIWEIALYERQNLDDET